jgi:aspartate beta-hydroxylase
MPWHDPQQFQLVRDLEAAADKIAAELRALPGSGFQDEAEEIDRSGRWSVFYFYERGRRNDDNCSLCPETVAAIEANRTVLSLGGPAYFSKLDPNTHIAPHRGPTNMRLRCHLGIDVPEDCGLRVGGISRTWEEGRCLVFDDRFTHEVWNESARARVVLVVDFWHPDLTDDEVALLNGLHWTTWKPH